MKRHQLILSAVIGMCTLAVATAQETRQATPYQNSISIQPLYLFNQGLRIDYERHLNNPANRLQLSARAYCLTDGSTGMTTLLFDSDWNIEKLSGAGLDVNYKYFLPKTRFLYVAAGASYSYFRMEHYDYVFADFHENNLTFYKPIYALQTQHFNKVGLNTYFGIQSSFYRHFFVDGYVGVGYCHSFYDKNKYYPDTDNMNGVSYNGPTATIGVSLGVRF